MRLSSLSAGIALATVSAAIMPAPPAMAQEARDKIALPEMPLADALRAIEARTGTKITYDPDAVAGVTSTPVRHATGALSAARDAIKGKKLTVLNNPAGGLMVVNDIVVIAHRDEAETSVLVRQTSTSDRSGQSLREQPRNTQVISAKLIQDQQDLTVLDALANAGVGVNTATVQGGNTYSVRGFTSDGLVNGLPGTSTTGVPAGTTSSVAAVERIEILKGPVAILAGSGNLGGAVNIVYKKPSADPLLQAEVDTGSYGLRRIVLDGNNAITSDKHLSARLIASASKTDQNFGGYRGDEDYLLLPELRFKNATTDVTIGVAASNTVSGLTPYTSYNVATKALYNLPMDKPIFSRDQYIRIVNTQYFVNAQQKVTDWLDVTARYQHQKTKLKLNYYSTLAILDPVCGLALLDNARSRQEGDSDAVDAFAKLRFGALGVQHTLVAGYSYVNGSTNSYSASNEDVFPQPFLGNAPAPEPIAPADTLSYLSGSRQNGYYAQDLVEFWKLHLLAGLRRTTYDSFGILYFRNGQHTSAHQAATTPNLGIVLDVTPAVSLFANYVKGFSPTFTRDYAGNQLPNIATRNVEGGVKVDLFHKGVTLNLSYFDLQQSNILIPDPVHRGFSIPGPGQEGKGIDFNASGTILPGWTVQASYTRTDYSFLNTTYGTVVQSAPRDVYSIYSAYERKIANDTSAGLSAGIFGRSKASVDLVGSYYVPAALQVDMNAMLRWRALSLNIGVRNLFDRRNYGTSYTADYIPYGTPRTWRLSVAYRFQ